MNVASRDGVASTCWRRRVEGTTLCACEPRPYPSVSSGIQRHPGLGALAATTLEEPTPRRRADNEDAMVTMAALRDRMTDGLLRLKRACTCVGPGSAVLADPAVDFITPST